MSTVPSLLALLRDCAGQEEPPAQSSLHPNPLQTLLLPWPLGAVCGYGDNVWPVPSCVPTHPSPVPAGLGTQLALLWQQPKVPECHHLVHPCPFQCSAASPTAEPSGWPPGLAVLLVPGPQLRDKGHPVELSLVLELDAHPIPLLGCPSPALLDPLVPVLSSSGAISPLDPTLPRGSGCHMCSSGCCAPSLGCTNTSGHGSGAGAVHGVGEHRAGLFPCCGVPTPWCPHVPSKLRSHVCLWRSPRCAAPGRFVT